MNEYTNEALRMLPYLQKGAQMLNDEDALQVKTIYPEWNAEASYELNEKVLFLQVLYKCTIAHDAQVGWEPVSATSLWAKVLIPDETIIPAWEQPDSTNPYMTGDKVMHNDKTWVSDIDNNVWEPGVYGWTEI